MTSAPFYVAINGFWRAYGFDPVDPTPDSSPQYPAGDTYPSWSTYPGTGA